jgi:hypothetical protein
MSDIHRTSFEQFLRGIDQGQIADGASSTYPHHLQSCLDCRLDFSLYEKLRAEAAVIWPASISPKRSAHQLLDGVNSRLGRQRWKKMLFSPIKIIAWAAIAVLSLMIINWVFSTLRAEPAEVPKPTPDMAVIASPEISEPTPQDIDIGINKIPLQPLLVGSDFIGARQWSPDGSHYFFIMVEPSEDPLSDRVFSTLNFLNVETGEICQHPQTILGRIDFSQPYWLSDGRLLFYSQMYGVQLFTPCQEQVVSLNEQFPEVIVSLQNHGFVDGYILLQGETRYWLLDLETLQVNLLEGLLPGADRTDKIVWSPSGEQLAIYQSAANVETESDVLTIIAVESGQILQRIPISSDSETGALMLEWLLDDKLFIWIFTPSGPKLVDLAEEEPRILNVFDDFFGLDLVYPDDLSGMGYFADETTGTFHITVRTNSPDLDALLIYHSETGVVERWTEDLHYYLFFPNGDFVFMNRWEDEPTYTDEYQLIWVDDPQKPTQTLEAVGHTPRNYPILWPRLLPGRAQIALGSSQGVSLVSLPDGELLNFWSLESEGEPNPSLHASPDGRFIVVTTTFQKEEFAQPSSALYLIQLQP